MSRDKLINMTADAMIYYDTNSESDQGKKWAMNINYWDWVPGVGMYALFRTWEHTRNTEYLGFIKGWVDSHLEQAYRVKVVNTTIPLVTVLEMYRITENPGYLKTAVDIGNWILKEAPRTREGALEHTVTEAADFSEQIWADTLFMSCIFLSKLGLIACRKEFTKEAAKQLLIHHRVLKDKNTGLFYHGWNCEEQNWMSGALWGRANAWITASTVELLENLPQDFTGREEIVKSLIEQVEALQKYQRVNGMFGTVLNDPEAYDETSAAAGIAYGIKRGIRSGFIPKKFMEVALKAEKAVIERINEKGEVEGVSTGTPVMPSIDDYKKIKTYPTLYGQALALMMLCERV
jgi:unsaturated rhamnogalacturonyl hydrolase